MRKRLSGQAGLRRKRQIEIPAQIDHQQPESAGPGKLLGGPQALAPSGETNHRKRRQVDAPLRRIGRKERALGPRDPCGRLTLLLCLMHQAERQGEGGRSAGARELGQAAAERAIGP